MKKKLLLILASIIILIASAVGTFFVAKTLDELDPTKKFSDAEFLTTFSEWKKVGTETVSWSFNSDGTCRLTTNGTEFFDCKWFLEDEILGIKTAWLTELDDEFNFTLDRNEKTFSVKSLVDGAESTFSAL